MYNKLNCGRILDIQFIWKTKWNSMMHDRMNGAFYHSWRPLSVVKINGKLNANMHSRSLVVSLFLLFLLSIIIKFAKQCITNWNSLDIHTVFPSVFRNWMLIFFLCALFHFVFFFLLGFLAFVSSFSAVAMTSISFVHLTRNSHMIAKSEYAQLQIETCNENRQQKITLMHLIGYLSLFSFSFYLHMTPGENTIIKR